MKIRPVGAELLHADGRYRLADLTKLMVAFCNFTNAPQKKEEGGGAFYKCLAWPTPGGTTSHANRRDERVQEYY